MHALPPPPWKCLLEHVFSLAHSGTGLVLGSEADSVWALSDLSGCFWSCLSHGIHSTWHKSASKFMHYFLHVDWGKIKRMKEKGERERESQRCYWVYYSAALHITWWQITGTRTCVPIRYTVENMHRLHMLTIFVGVHVRVYRYTLTHTGVWTGYQMHHTLEKDS